MMLICWSWCCLDGVWTPNYLFCIIFVIVIQKHSGSGTGSQNQKFWTRTRSQKNRKPDVKWWHCDDSCIKTMWMRWRKSKGGKFKLHGTPRKQRKRATLHTLQASQQELGLGNWEDPKWSQVLNKSNINVSNPWGTTFFYALHEQRVSNLYDVQIKITNRYVDHYWGMSCLK